MTSEEQERFDTLSAHLLVIHSRIILLEGRVRALQVNTSGGRLTPEQTQLQSEDMERAMTEAGHEFQTVREILEEHRRDEQTAKEPKQ